MTLLVVGLSATLFYRLGRIIEGRQVRTEQRLSEREIQNLTEMRVMREWQLQLKN